MPLSQKILNSNFMSKFTANASRIKDLKNLHQNSFDNLVFWAF